MSFRFSTPWVPVISFLLLLSSCSGLTTKDHPPLVFALNLSSETVSLSLVGGDKVLAAFPEVAPLESRPLTKVPVSDGVVLTMIPGEQTAEMPWTDPSGTPYSLRFQTGRLYAIVVDSLGKAALYSLPETYTADPKLCVVNVLPTTLAQVQAAPDWAKNVKVYSQDVAPVVPSEFYSFEPKTLGLYWQTQEQTADGSHTVAIGDDGRPQRPTFEANRYYLFLAGDGAVRDLTPTLD